MSKTRTLLLLLALSVAVLCAPSCTTNKKFDQTAIFTTAGEYFPYYMDDFFTGTNLTFMNTSALPAGNKFINPIEEVKNSTAIEVDNDFVAVAAHEAETGQVTIAILAVSDDGGYDVWCGNTTGEDDLPDLSFKQELPMSQNQYRCYDIQFLNEIEFVIGCVNISSIDSNGNDQVSMTELVLIRPMDGLVKVYQFENWEHLDTPPDNMKLRLYEPFLLTDDEDINFNDHFFDQTYILSSFLYEGFESDNQTSIDVFRYVLDDRMQNSVIIQHCPIDFSALDSWQNTLTISDFDEEEDHIFILDEFYGFYQFWLWGDEVMDVNHFDPELPGAEDFVSLAVTLIDEEYYFTILCADKIMEYKIIDLEEETYNDFIFQFKVPLGGIIIEDYVPIESNEEYITLKVGEIVFIHDRRLKGQFKSTIRNVGEYELLWSDDVFIFSPYLIDHRKIERPILAITEPWGAQSQFYELDIKAVSMEWNVKQECTLTLISEVFTDPNDQGIFCTLVEVGPEYGKKDCSGDLANNFVLDDDYVGPNIDYEAILMGPVTKKIEESEVKPNLRRKPQQTLKREDVSKPPEVEIFAEMPRQVSYLRIPAEDWNNVVVVKVEHETEDKFYAFFQFRDFDVVIYECYVDDDNNTSVDCESPNYIHLDQIIDVWDVGRLGDKNQLVWSYVSADDQIFFYNFDCILVATIQSYRQGYDIIDIEVMGDSLYVIYNFEGTTNRTTTQIDVRYFDPIQRFRRKYRLNYRTVRRWPRMTIDRWQPTKIMLSEDYPDIAFVDLEDSNKETSILAFYQGNQEAEYVYMHLVNAPADAYITGDSLFLYLFDQLPPVIKEYSLRDLDVFKYMKDLPMYGQILMRSKVEKSNSGLLYAMSNVDNETSLLIYHNHHMLIDSLYKKLVMPFKYNMQYPVRYHVDGDTRDTILVIQNNSIYAFRAPQHPYITVYGHMQRDDYITNFPAQLIMTPWDNVKYDEIILDLSMRMLNQQLYVKPNQTAFAISGLKNITLDSNQAVSQVVLYDSEWFTGSVFNFQLECTEYFQDCQNGNIQITNTVEKVDYDVDYIGLAEDIFYDETDTQRIYVLTKNNIYILDRSLALVEPPVSIGLDSNVFECDYMAESYSKYKKLDMIFVFCQNNTDRKNSYESYVPISFYTVEPIASTPISLKAITGMDQVAIDGSYIFINDFEDQASFGEIYAYPINITASDGEYQFIFDKNYFESPDPQFEIISFEILPTSDPLTSKLLVATVDMVMYAVNYRSALEMQRQGIKADKPMWALDLREELEEQQLYFTDSTILEKTFTIFFYPGKDPYSLTSNYFTLIHTSDTAIYVSELVFNESKTASDSDKFKMDFFAVFNNYGNYQSQVTLKGNTQSDSFAEVYKSPDREEYILAVYSFELDGWMNKLGQVKQDKATKLISEPFSGAVVYHGVGDMGFNDNYEFYQDLQNQWHILVIDPMNQTVQGAKIREFPMLTISNKAQPQKIRMQAVSDFALDTDYFEFNLQQKYIPPPPPPSNNGSFPWWGILLIIIGVLGLAAGGFFAYKFYKNKKNSDPELLSLQKTLPEQAGVSNKD